MEADGQRGQIRHLLEETWDLESGWLEPWRHLGEEGGGLEERGAWCEKEPAC